MFDSIEMLLLVIPILLFSIVIHEMAHGYAALFLGDPTAKNMGRLTLNPIVHLDPIWSVAVPTITMLVAGFFFGMAKPVMYNPANLRNRKWGEAIVAIAGPASNVGIALIFVLAINVLSFAGVANEVLYQALGIVVIMNIFLALFNMIPLAPLDGSKILYALLGPQQQHIRYWMEQNSMLLTIGLVIIVLNTSFLSSMVLWITRVLL